MHARVINLWECLRKPLVKALPALLPLRRRRRAAISPPHLQAVTSSIMGVPPGTLQKASSLGIFSVCLHRVPSCTHQTRRREKIHYHRFLKSAELWEEAQGEREISHSIRLTVQLQCRQWEGAIAEVVPYRHSVSGKQASG